MVEVKSNRSHKFKRTPPATQQPQIPELGSTSSSHRSGPCRARFHYNRLHHAGRSHHSFDRAIESPGNSLRMNQIHCAALLFDMDGVLIDSTPAVARVWRQWAIEHGFDPEQVVA